MAAPSRKMATGSFTQLLYGISRSAAGCGGCRRFSTSPVGRATPRASTAADRVVSPWSLVAAVCLQRLPVVSADYSPIEQRFKQMMQQMELEKSLLSDHELRLMDDAERMSRKQADDYDSDEDHGDQEIMLAQDLEDTWEQRFKSFQPAPRVRADVDKDLTCVQRCLADSLVLLAEQQVGAEKLWLLPQAAWQEGETMRQTAERALGVVTAAGFKATFLGNAPCGVYKYKLPKAARTETSVATKVFFFKAILAESAPGEALNTALIWVKKSEMQKYLKPAYMMKVDRLILTP